MLSVKSGTKIYIVCPANLATGGPELLHQLAFRLRAMKFEAVMYYLPSDVANPVHPFYAQYEVPFVRETENIKGNIIVIPEALTTLIYDQQFSSMTKAIWWLSVDHYFPAVNELLERHRKKKTFKIKHLFNYYKIPTLGHIARDKKLVHLVQSVYAKDFLARHKVRNIFYLSDYLNQAFLSKAEKAGINDRKDVVLYNPKKGLEFTQEIMKSAPEINFLPIQNLTPEEVSQLLLSSKVYIDFGSHPGKDRFPREAAMMGCCIITGKMGSANFREDLPIDDEFKFADDRLAIPGIIRKIEDCLKNFETETKKFAAYREWIKKEQTQFNEDVAAIFKAG